MKLVFARESFRSPGFCFPSGPDREGYSRHIALQRSRYRYCAPGLLAPTLGPKFSFFEASGR